MFKTLLSVSLIVCALTASPAAQAQQLSGNWFCRQWNAGMSLRPNATYQFRGPRGASSGTYGVRGKMFWMKDASGRTLHYTVRQLSATALVLADPQGNLLTFARVGAAGKAAASATPAPSPGGGQVLSRKGQHVLTTASVATGVGIIQFVVGQRIKASEIKELQRASIKEFNAAPAQFMAQIVSLQRSLAQLQRLQNALHIGAARQLLLAAFHKGTRAIKPKDRPLLIRVINRYVKVLAYDAANNLALTDRDAVAALRYMQFSYKLAGQEFNITPKLAALFVRSTVKAFPTMPLAQKKFFCSASLAYRLIVANWARLSAARQAKLRAAYARRQQQAARQPAKGQRTASGGAGGSTIKFPPGWSKMTRAQKRALLRKKMRGNMARQNMFRMMQNSATRHHATMLNTIENFGGTGNYWKVVPSY